MNLICFDPAEIKQSINKYMVSTSNLFALTNDVNKYCLFLPLGIWADDSDHEERQGSSKGIRKPKDYSAPIGFVAGGVQQAGKKNEKKTESDAESEKSDEDGISF